MKQLLLIDDDPSFRHVMARALTRRGYSVAVAATPLDALCNIKETVPDYAVVDMKLEDGSGLELIGPFRAVNPAMRIVVLTGYASIPTTVMAIKLGADNYLAKPIDLDGLVAALEDAPPHTPAETMEPMSLRRLEWEHIQRILDEHEGNVSTAARALGMHRRTLQRKLAKKPLRR